MQRIPLLNRGGGQEGGQPPLSVPVQRRLNEAQIRLFHGEMRGRGEESGVHFESQIGQPVAAGVGQAGGQARLQRRPVVAAHQVRQLGEQEGLEGARSRLLAFLSLKLVHQVQQLFFLYEDEGRLKELKGKLIFKKILGPIKLYSPRVEAFKEPVARD